MSPDALRIATANMDGVVRVYDVERGEPVITQRQAFVACRVVTYSGGQVCLARGPRCMCI